MHLLLNRWLAGLLAGLVFSCPALRGDDAGSEKSLAIRDVVRDGGGQVWGIATGDYDGLYRFVNDRWLVAPVDGLTGKKFFPLALTRRADGAVVCLWRNSGEDRFFSVQRGASGEPPKAIAAAIPEPGSGLPQLFADSKNNVWLTNNSPDICRLSPDGTAACPHVIALDEGMAGGSRDPGSTRIYGWNKVLACEDAQGRVWFHSEGFPENYASLRGVLVYDGAAFTLHDPIPADYRHRQVTALVPKDAGHLWFGIIYDGLYTLDTATFQLEKVPGQPVEARGSPEIFSRGGDWYFVLQGLGSAAGHSLWRWRGGSWEKLVDAVDAGSVGNGRSRLWERADGGDFLGSVGNGLWFVPDDGPPRTLNWQQGFPLGEPLRMVPVAGQGRWLGLDTKGQVWVGKPGDLLAKAASDNPRISYVRSGHPFVVDAHRHLWGFRAAEAKVLGEWDGEKWTAHDLPVEGLTGSFYRRPMGVDGLQRVWVSDDGTQRHTTLIYEPAQDRWQHFESFESALEAQAPLGKPAELPASAQTDDLSRFGPHGQICHLSGGAVLGWFDGEVWRHWRRSEVQGPETRYGFDGPPFFTDAGGLAINIHKETWEYAGENVWKRAALRQPGYADDEARTASSRRVAPPPGAVTRTPESIVLDSQGLCWLTWKQQLYRSRDGLCAPVFQPGEVQPFIDGRRLSSVLIDARGNAFLRSDALREYVVLSAPGPLPHTSLEIAPSTGPDARVVRLTSDAAPSEGKVRFDWRLDDGAWQSLAADAQPAAVTLEALRGGPHRFEARSFDPALQTDAAPAVLPFEVRIDAQAQIAGYVAQLAEPDDDRRKAAVMALARLPELALPALEAARARAADDNLRWWIEAALQQIDTARAANPPAAPVPAR